MITINPNAADVITINISDADQIQLNTTAIVLVGGDSGGGNADTLNNQSGAYYLSRANHTNTQAISTVSGLQTALDSKLESVAWGDIDGNLTAQTDLQDALNLKLDAADYNDRFLGLFLSVFDLEAAHPTASAGDYAQVDLGIGSDVIIYAWDVSDAKWAAVGGSAIANTDALPEGSSNLYFTSQRVRDTPLTGLSTATAAPITAADSVLSAAGKLQAQISASGGGGSTFRKFPAGVWSNQHVTYVSSSATYGNASFFMLIAIPQAITITNLGLGFSTTVAGRRARIRFYTPLGVAVTGVFEFDAADMNASTAITPLTLPAGRYLLALSHSGTGTSSNLRSINASACEPVSYASAVFGGASGITGYSFNEAFAGSLPDDVSLILGYMTGITNQPAVFIKVT